MALSNRGDPWSGPLSTYEEDPNPWGMDADRHQQIGCWPNAKTWVPRLVNHGGPVYWRVVCSDCRTALRAATRGELLEVMHRHEEGAG